MTLAVDPDGTFSRLDGDQPLATQTGKPSVVHRLRERLPLRGPVAMVGDGSTDAAVRGVVDAFIAFTGVAHREKVVAVADAVATSFPALHALLLD